MKKNTDYHYDSSHNHDFLTKSNNSYKPIGDTYKINPRDGEGICWRYDYKDLYSIVIYDFYFHKDYYLEMTMPEVFSVIYYISVSGEEFTPYQNIKSNTLRFYNSNELYQVIYHSNLPIKSIAIELKPKYINDFLLSKFPDNYIDLKNFFSTSFTQDFPELAMLFHKLFAFEGKDLEAQLYYDSKVSEALSLIVNRYLNPKLNMSKYKISEEDLSRLENVTHYINHHYSFNLSLSILSSIACMSLTKLKTSFKKIYNCTITEYIQQARVREGEHMLISTNLSLKNISEAVGYSNPSRFSEIFKRINGVSPSEYKKMKGACTDLYKMK